MKRIIQIATLFIVGLCVGAMLAQQPKQAPKQPVTAGPPLQTHGNPPVIPDALQAKYWKAQAQITSAEASLRGAQQAAQQTIEEIQRACGPDFQAQPDQKGDPVCVAKPPKTGK